MRALNFETFVERACRLHDNKYDYSKVTYVNQRTKVLIVCPIHGDFCQNPYVHSVAGSGCEKCGNAAAAKKHEIELEDFLRKAKSKHGDRYDYSETRYTASVEKVRIICHKHGGFEQRADSHLQGHGCPSCGAIQKVEKRRYTCEEFVAKCRERHGNLYDYSLVQYTGNSQHVAIICVHHGPFVQTANCHISGHGCPGCYRSRSNFSRSAVEWLTYRSNVDNTHIQHAMNGGEYLIRAPSGKRMHVDGYSAQRNQVYEYLGGYFHGDPRLYAADDINRLTKRRMGDLYSETVERRGTIIALGYNYVEIWEADFLKLKKLGFIDAELLEEQVEKHF